MIDELFSISTPMDHYICCCLFNCFCWKYFHSEYKWYTLTLLPLCWANWGHDGHIIWMEGLLFTKKVMTKIFFYWIESVSRMAFHLENQMPLDSHGWNMNWERIMECNPLHMNIDSCFLLKKEKRRTCIYAHSTGE